MNLQSDEIKELVAALVKVQSDIRDAEKNSVNPHFKNQYANLEAVIEATRAPFAKHGLVVTQLGTVSEFGPTLVTVLMHTSGQWIRSVVPILNERNSAQGMGSAISYARRYALSAIAGITQVDDDGEAASSAMANVTLKPVSEPLKSRPPANRSAPICCGKPMSISKYVDRDLGHAPWYCTACKSKVPVGGA